MAGRMQVQTMNICMLTNASAFESCLLYEMGSHAQGWRRTFAMFLEEGSLPE
jgi:hypothetical protein